jgi:hypothetical protein
VNIVVETGELVGECRCACHHHVGALRERPLGCVEGGCVDTRFGPVVIVDVVEDLGRPQRVDEDLCLRYEGP